MLCCLKKLARLVMALFMVCIVLTNTARADIQDWLPDFGEWTEKGLKPFFDMITSKVKQFIDTVIGTILHAYESIKTFFLDLWKQYLVFLTALQEFITNTFDWIWATWEVVWEWLCELPGECWDFICELTADICEWVWDWVLYYFEYSFELGLSYMDWCVVSGKMLLEKILSMLPDLELPSGFEDGLRYFVSYGMVLDKVFPVTELLELITLYFTIFLALLIHKQMKGWWRWIGWFNK